MAGKPKKGKVVRWIDVVQKPVFRVGMTTEQRREYQRLYGRWWYRKNRKKIQKYNNAYNKEHRVRKSSTTREEMSDSQRKARDAWAGLSYSAYDLQHSSVSQFERKYNKILSGEKGYTGIR